MDGSISIHVNGKKVAKDRGEIQLTDYGISGIPVFQVSGIVAKELAKEHDVTGVLDFIPQLSLKEFEVLLSQRIENNPDKLMKDFLIGLFPKKFADLIIKLCGHNPNEKVSRVKANDETMLMNLALRIVEFETKIIDTNSFDQAQVCAGGVDTREVNSNTMESLLVKNLYFAGEVVDVDGICGGYNLQWAWSSGYVAGSLSKIK
jgi:predicted Rossmann fold flavoprotein